MALKLRTVIFQSRVEIENVPIFTCPSCNRSSVFPPVKPDLSRLIQSFGDKPDKQQVFFNEANELSFLMCKASDKRYIDMPIEVIIQDRINELLDMLLLCQSLGDVEWIDDTRHRLAQITEHMSTAYDFHN
ncbi:hypothetical protein WBG83_19370 [Paenibacillus sp. y28]